MLKLLGIPKALLSAGVAAFAAAWAPATPANSAQW